jgi:hypothetical protein
MGRLKCAGRAEEGTELKLLFRGSMQQGDGEKSEKGTLGRLSVSLKDGP